MARCPTGIRDAPQSRHRQGRKARLAHRAPDKKEIPFVPQLIWPVSDVSSKIVRQPRSFGNPADNFELICRA
jgi:hypothetical protein